MRASSSFFAVVTLAVLALSIAPSPARVVAQQQQVPSTLPGAWRYPHPEAHGVAIVRAAIEPAISSLPSMFQGIARDRLASRTRIASRIEIGTASQRVQVASHGERDFTVDLALGASPSTLRGPEGNEVQAQHRLVGGWLEEVFSGPNGDLRILYSTEPSGQTMHVDVTISSERLSTPIRYRLDYVRAE